MSRRHANEKMTGRFLPLFRRELQVLFFSPLAYLVMTIFLVISGYYFYTLFTVYSIQSFQAAQTPTLAQNLNLIEGISRPLFLLMGVLSLLVLPLLTMRLFAEERKTGTLDLLLTYPVREGEVVLAKFSATAVLFLAMVALTYPYPLMLFYYAHLDPGAFFSGYVGLLLLGGAFMALGILLSALTEHQVIAAVVTLGILFFSWLLSSAPEFLSGASGAFFAQFSILYHLRGFAKGVIETSHASFYILITLGSLFLTVYALAARRRGGWFAMRRGLRGIPAGLVLAVAGVVLLQLLSSFFSWRLDLTQAREFTLSDSTMKVLRGLNRDVRVTAFAKKGSPYHKRMEDLLSLYAKGSRQWKYTLVDPDKNSSLAEKYGASGFGVLVVIESAGKEARARLPFEEEITGALLKVTQTSQKALCFVTGHGEHDLNDPAKSGYNSVHQELLRNGYSPKTVSLTAENGLQDCALLVFAGARIPFQAGEIDLIKNFLVSQKPALFLLEPGGSESVSQLIEEEFHLRPEPGTVVDRTSKVFGGEYQMPVVSKYGVHRISQGFTLITFYPSAQAFRLSDPLPAGWVPLVQTGRESWLELDPVELQRGDPHQESPREQGGPLTLAVAGVSGDIYAGRTARWVVVGDSDFIANAYFNLAGNGRFFMNIVNWLAEDEAMILAGVEKNTAPQPVFLTSAQARITFLLTVVLFPAILLGIGGFVVYRRWR